MEIITEFNKWAAETDIVPVGRADKLNKYHIGEFLKAKCYPKGEAEEERLYKLIHPAWCEMMR